MIPIPKQGDDFSITPPQKQINLKLAYSQLKNGKWTPKKVSKTSIDMGLSIGSIVYKKDFLIVPSNSDVFNPLNKNDNSNFIVSCYKDIGEKRYKTMGAFTINGCKGIPEAVPAFLGMVAMVPPPRIKLPRFVDTIYQNMKSLAINQGRSQALTLTDNKQVAIPILANPGVSNFEILESWQPSMIDAYLQLKFNNDALYIGTFMPYFFRDSQRTFWAYNRVVNPESNEVFGVAPVAKFYRFLFAYEVSVIKLKVDLNANLITQVQFDKAFNDLNDQLFKDSTVQPTLAKVIFTFPRTSFYTFYHPMVCLFASQIYKDGIRGLMKRSTQLADKGFNFEATYKPTVNVETRYPRENVDFTPDGSYSTYNWELFFHAPLMIATRLAKDQKFEEALTWFHYIFNPLDPTPSDPANPASKYWVTKPFFERQKKEYNFQRIDILLKKLAGDPTVPADDTAMIPPFTKQEIGNQVSDWRTHPFEPHIVAEYRTVAYQKTVIMKYLDTLIAWGDQLYRQDSMESINEATQLYIMAAEILGSRPYRVPPQYKALPETFHELETKMDALSNRFVPGIDAFSNSLVTGLENLVPAVPATPAQGFAPPLPNVLYFSLPQNDKLLSYWETVASRLYNIRHGMNLEGVKRTLALFAPVIDPAALVKAVAGGASVASALADMAAPMPIYRFSVASQKANELCSDVKGLGSALLSALEKKDGEALGLLRQTHEIAVLESVKAIKMLQIEDAKLSLEGLHKNRELITIRRDYYASRDYINVGEGIALGLNAISTYLEVGVTVANATATGLKLLPTFVAGVSGLGSPVVTVGSGGQIFW